ncbi:CGGC domain-containing protein [Candidatus Latescibacterota bacterium]
MDEKDYIVVVQCHLVKQRCSGYFCEQAFHNREGEFTRYPADIDIRSIYMTCGGCCGRAMHRKLGHLVRKLKKDRIEKDRIVVHLSSCAAKDNYHSPVCPHLDYLHTLIDRLGLDVVDGTRISKTAEKRREDGAYGGI